MLHLNFEARVNMRRQPSLIPSISALLRACELVTPLDAFNVIGRVVDVANRIKTDLFVACQDIVAVPQTSHR
jgi:hypothetical protein